MNSQSTATFSDPSSGISYLPYELQQNDDSCECGKRDFVEDHHTGDKVCTSCGIVQSERAVSSEAEYRCFSEDSSSRDKIRVGASYRPNEFHSLTEKSRWIRDENEFLNQGLRSIDDYFYLLYNGDCQNTPAQYRAKELFQRAFKFQVDQKRGLGSKMKNNQNRQKFSKKKQFMVASCWYALHESNVKKSVSELNESLEGKCNVSDMVAKRCLNELQLGLPSLY